MLGARRTESGLLFQTVGAAHENRRDAVTIRDGTLTSWPRVNERGGAIGCMSSEVMTGTAVNRGYVPYSRSRQRCSHVDQSKARRKSCEFVLRAGLGGGRFVPSHRAPAASRAPPRSE